ncbi:MAG: hypothetical protein IMZ50_12520 [Candidatus Atribacteria bacterium]|nr:hypothetical protein [Candidatus Atribacteria bacterium]
MSLSKGSVKNFLDFLEKVYPNAVSNLEDIKSPSINPNDLPALIELCREEVWITADIIDSLGGPRKIENIKITGNGIRYLKGF